MAWLGVDFLSEGREGEVGSRVCFLLEAVAPELCEERAFGNEVRRF